MNDSSEQSVPESKKSNLQWKVQFWALCGMLVLALIGMGLTQALEKGAWEYWLLVVVVYAALGLWRSASKAKQKGRSVRELVGREFAHWMILLIFLGVVLLLERQEIINRQSASDVSLLLLAMSCCMAGVHFDWLLLIVGVVLTIMVVALATLQQYSIGLWVVMVLAAVVAAAFFYFKSKRGD